MWNVLLPLLCLPHDQEGKQGTAGRGDHPFSSTILDSHQQQQQHTRHFIKKINTPILLFYQPKIALEQNAGNIIKNIRFYPVGFSGQL